MGLDWTQILQAMHDPKSPIAQGMIGNANYLTAAICMLTHNRPGSACATPTMHRLERALPRTT
jgi:hypothetical protein